MGMAVKEDILVFHDNTSKGTSTIGKVLNKMGGGYSAS